MHTPLPPPPPPAWEPVPGLGPGLWADEPWLQRLLAWLGEQGLGPQARLVVRPRSGGGGGARVVSGAVEAANAAHAFLAAVRTCRGALTCIKVSTYP